MNIPHKPDVENTVLCSMLVDAKACDYACQVLTDKAFANGNAKVFNAIVDVRRTGAIPDTVLVGQKIDPVKLAEILEYASAQSSNISKYCEVLIETAVLRGCTKTFHQACEYAGKPEAKAHIALSTAEKRIMEYRRAMEMVGGDEQYDHREAINRFMSEVERRKGHEGVRGLPLPSTKLSTLIDGIEPGKKYLISGFEKGGKSRFLRCCVSQWANQGHAGLMIQTEESHDDIFKCVLAHRTRINTRDISAGRLTDEEYGELQREADRLKEQPLIIRKKPAATPAYVREEIEKARTKFLYNGTPLKYIIIDTVQKMRREADSTNEMHELIASELEVICSEYNIAMIWVMQFVAAAERAGIGKKAALHSNIRYGKVYRETADCMISFDDRRKSKKELEAEKANGFRAVRTYVVQREGESHGFVDIKAELKYSSYGDLNEKEKETAEEVKKQVEDEQKDGPLGNYW